MRVVLAVARRAVRLEPDAARERGAAQHRLEPLRRRVAPEDERAQRPAAVRRVAAGELGDVDPVPDAAHLLRRERERPLVDGDDRRGDLLGRADDRVSLPVRVPEHERDAERAHERRGEHRVERNHVRDDADRPRPQLARERRRVPRPALRLRPCAELVHARVRRHRVGHAPSRRARRARPPARRARAPSAPSPRARDRPGRAAASRRSACAWRTACLRDRRASPVGAMAPRARSGARPTRAPRTTRVLRRRTPLGCSMSERGRTDRQCQAKRARRSPGPRGRSATPCAPSAAPERRRRCACR